MKDAAILKRKISLFLKRGQLLKGEEYLKLEKPFLAKARKNLTIASLMAKISGKENQKRALSLSLDFEMYDWAVIIAYYSMYSSALAAIARLGFKSKSHSATVSVLEYGYVHQQKGMEIKHLEKLSGAYTLSKELISKLIQTKTKRETAQYNATPLISRENALSAIEDADEFLTKIEGILR